MCSVLCSVSFIKQNKAERNKANAMDAKLGQTQVIIVHHVDHNEKGSCINKRCWYYFTLTGILVCALFVLSSLAIEIVKYSKNTTNRNSSDTNPDADDRLHIITRKEWIAMPPNNKLKPLETPVSKVIIASTGTENCTTQADCTFQVRTIQTFHIEARGWDDIGYNFLVGGDGAIYVGRGWDLMGAHTKGHNFNSICFAFIGTFNSIQPPKHQLIAAQKMIAEGVRLKKLTADYALYGHRQFFATLSPGTALYEIIKTWDHWTEVIRE